jgi:hypothetical protein
MTCLRTALHLSFVLIVLALLALTSKPALAHGGGIDAYGGHKDTKNGNYHVHQGNVRRTDVCLTSRSH